MAKLIIYRDALRDVRNYEKLKDSTIPYEIVDRPSPKPANALSVTRSQLRDVNVYQRLKAQAEREGRQLVIVDEEPTT